MATFWISEALPIAVTALLPLVLLPLLGAGGIKEVAAPYAHPLIFLFLGGFLIALAMERWNLHRRLALKMIQRVGARPRALVAGFMVSAALLSMWISNTATAMMMMPLGLSIVQLKRSGAASSDLHQDPFAQALMLGIAYGASIGGVGTLIGTPPNALLAGFLEETYGLEIGFAQWMKVGVPLVILALPLCFFILTYLVFPLGQVELGGEARLIEGEIARLGPLSRAEKMVGAVFVLVAALWITRPWLAGIVPHLSDASIAIAGAVVLFALPVDHKRGVFVLNWEWARRLPWNVLILFGGGLSLAAAIQRNGLAGWLGQTASLLQHWPVVLTVLLITLLIVVLTELTSNTATAATFLPVAAAIALGIGQNPLLLLVPATLGASLAFMLPVATPPNAIVYGSGCLTIPTMVRAGVFLVLACVALVVLFAFTGLGLALDVIPGEVPDWAAQ
jgi:sodium-dependent dicarboxylate transporter 2/3/5